MKPRTIIIASVVVILLGIAILYFAFHYHVGGVGTTPGVSATGSLPSSTTQQFPNNTTGQNGTGANASGTVPSAFSSAASFGIVTSEPTLDYFVDAQNDAVAIEPTGQVEEVASGASQPIVISSPAIQSIISASFSYDGKKIMVSFGDPANPQTSIFDVATKAWLLLPQGMQNPVWSPTNYRIAYLTSSNAATETIVIGNLATSTVKTVSQQAVSMEDSLLQWPSANVVILSDKPSAFTVGSALAVNITTKAITPLIVEYPGMESIWNSAPMFGLVFFGNTGDQGGSLSLVNPNGTQQALNFNTLPSKCAFNDAVSTSTQTVAAVPSKKAGQSLATSTTITVSTTTLDLYCAVPRDQSTFSIARLPDEYDQKMYFTADDFYMINTASGALGTVFSDPNQTLDATDLKIFNGFLFFVNRYDQKLYGIKLGD